MPNIKSTLRLNDVMSGTLRKINSALSTVLDTFEAVQRASGNSIDTAKLADARREISGANAAIDEMEASYRAAANGQDDLNERIREGSSAADGLAGKVRSIASAYAIKKGVDFIRHSLELFDTQFNAETQLNTVLNNMGAAEGSLDRLRDKASAIQKKSIFGDEALLGGASEFATYMTDDKAIGVMMDTLANYAAGMSGGEEVDYKGMVDYATGLGKIMNGSYEAMTKKGFKFTEQQKQIIENGTEMEKALVISDVVNESWGNLAERMANTPSGKIIQLKNTFGDIREELASRIYPAVMQLFDSIGSWTGRAGNFVASFAKRLNVVIRVISGILDAAGKLYDFFVDHWSLIAPVIYTIVGALAVYHAAMLIANAVDAISTGIETAQAGAKLALSVATGTVTAATAAQIAAQQGLNAALYACPIVWIIAAVLALIAIIIALVVWIAKTKDESISTLGAIMGALYTAGAWIWNRVLSIFELILTAINGLISPFVSFGNFVANVFRDPVASVIKLFGDMADSILRMLQGIASALDLVFNSNLASAVEGWRSSLSTKITAAMEEKGNGKYQEILPQIDLSVEKFGLERWSYKDAWDAGVAKGNQWDESLSGMFDFDSLLGDGGTGLGSDIDDIADNTGQTASNTGKNSEELAYLRDIAEKEAINRFTTASITVDMTGMTNRIESDMDIDGIISHLTEGVAEALVTAGEGVY